MKIGISLNGKGLCTAGVSGKGHLGAHINLDDKAGTGNPKMKIHINGYDTNDPAKTKYLKWSKVVLEKGDRIEIEVMPDSPIDAPFDVKSSIKDKESILTTDKQAEYILETAYSCNRLLNEMLYNLKRKLPSSEYEKVGFGVSTMINEVFSSLAEPIYRKHPSKVPEGLKDLPL